MVILTLLLPTLTLALLTRAQAQVGVLPTWAVVEFANLKAPGTPFGRNAAAAFIGELGKSGRYDVVPQETIQRAIETLGVDSPPKDVTNLLRVAQEVKAPTVVRGDVVDYEVRNVGGGKQARVSERIVVYDVASGIAVNGAVVTGVSTTRPSNTTDESLINDAIAQAASNAVRDIQTKTLPNATILNTLIDTALINQGARSGFKVGQPVIVTRGREQVATARVSEIEPDNGTIKVERSIKGLQPGDKVRAIFAVPDVRPGFTNNGEARVKRGPRLGNPSGLLTVLIVLGIVALLLSNGNSNSQSAVTEVIAEAIGDTTLAAGESAVRISWNRNGFSNSNGAFRWQVYRSDVGDVPVTFAPGNQSSVINRSTVTTESFPYLNTGQIGGVDCNTGNSTGTAVVRPVTSGRPYQYSVELVYRNSPADLPGGNTGGQTATAGTATATATNTTGAGTGANNTTTATGTTTAGTATATATTGATATTTAATTGTTTTGATTAGVFCYFVSERTQASGIATPLVRPTGTAPADAARITGNQVFQFQSVVNPTFPSAIEYVLEFSSTLSFANGTVFEAGKIQSGNFGTLSFPSINVSGDNIPANIRNATAIYWRVGARNVVDNPGPVEQNGRRYVYSYPPRSFSPPGGPPPPP